MGEILNGPNVLFELWGVLVVGVEEDRSGVDILGHDVLLIGFD